MFQRGLHHSRPSGVATFCYLAVLTMSAVLCSDIVDSEYVDIYILGGQSNMSGRGGVEVIANGTKVFDGKGPDTGGVTLHTFQGLQMIPCVHKEDVKVGTAGLWPQCKGQT